MEKTLEQLLDEYKRLGTVGLEQGPPMPPAPEQAPVRPSIASPKPQSYSSIVNPEEADLEMPVPQEYDIPTKSQMSEDESLVNPNLQRPMMFNKGAVTQEDLPPVGGASREPASEPTPDYSDAALLHDAQTAEINNRLMAGLSRSGALVGTAFANMGQQKPAASVDETGYKSLSDMAGAPMDQFKAGQSLKDSLISRKAKELDLNDEKAMRDPNSPISKALRSTAKLVGLNVPDDISGSQLKAGGMNMGSLLSAYQMAQARKENAALARQDRAAAMEDRGEQRSTESNRRYETKLSEALNKIDKDEQEANMNIDTARAVADKASTNPQAANMLAKMMVKAVEGAGARISDKDAQLALRAGGVSEEAQASLRTYASGTTPPFQVKDIKKMLDILSDFSKNKFKERKQKTTQRAANVMHIDPTELKKRMLIEDENGPSEGSVPAESKYNSMSNEELKKLLGK